MFNIFYLCHPTCSDWGKKKQHALYQMLQKVVCSLLVLNDSTYILYFLISQMHKFFQRITCIALQLWVDTKFVNLIGNIKHHPHLQLDLNIIEVSFRHFMKMGNSQVGCTDGPGKLAVCYRSPLKYGKSDNTYNELYFKTWVSASSIPLLHLVYTEINHLTKRFSFFLFICKFLIYTFLVLYSVNHHPDIHFMKDQKVVVSASGQFCRIYPRQSLDAVVNEQMQFASCQEQACMFYTENCSDQWFSTIICWFTNP